MLKMTVAPIIDFGNNFRINLANERWQSQGFRLAVAGSSGSGKSYLVSVLLEEIHGLGIPFLVIALRTLAGSATSITMGDIFCPERFFRTPAKAAVFSSFAPPRANRARSAPHDVSSLAVSKPIPLDAPVIYTFFPS